jgi:hypothetical protein
MNGPNERPVADRREKASRRDAIGLPRIFASRTVRRYAFWAAVLIGGGLQDAYTSTKHPSTALTVWAWFYGVVVSVCIIAAILGLAVYATKALPGWLRRRRGAARR